MKPSFITLGLSVILLAYVDVFAEKMVYAGLRLELDFQNQASDIERCGNYCSTGCVNEFGFCLRKGNSSSGGCNLFSTWARYRFEKSIYKELVMEPAQPLPSSYSLELRANLLTINYGKRSYTYEAVNFNLPTDGTKVDLPMKLVDGKSFAGDQRLNVSMTLSCAKFYFGPRCETYCHPDAEKYTCTIEGKRVCRPGYIGELCDKVDWCSVKSCPGDTTCINKPETNETICVGLGGQSEDCYQKIGPCTTQPCQNDGICIATGTGFADFVCKCTELWTGTRCNIRRSACTEALERMITGQAMEPPCLNQGLCVDIMANLSFICSCPRGWRGRRCEISTECPINANWMLALSATCNVLFVLATLIIVCCFWCQYNNKYQHQRGLTKTHLSSTLSTGEKVMKSPTRRKRIYTPRKLEFSEKGTQQKSFSCDQNQGTDLSQLSECGGSDNVPMIMGLNTVVDSPNGEENPPPLPIRNIPELGKNLACVKKSHLEPPAGVPAEKLQTNNMYSETYEIVEE